MCTDPEIHWLGTQNYEPCWHAMREFTDTRNNTTQDQIWVVEHPPVFTQGQAGKPEHVLNPSSIPVIATDRGGQVTYHGPGQVVIYPLINLKRHKLGIKSLVNALEQTVIDFLQEYQVSAKRKDNAPGVYVGEFKIAALGLRIRKGCSYHGLAVNLDLDLEPFSRINPCGFVGMEVTSLKKLGVIFNKEEATHSLLKHLLNKL